MENVNNSLGWRVYSGVLNPFVCFDTIVGNLCSIVMFKNKTLGSLQPIPTLMILGVADPNGVEPAGQQRFVSSTTKK